MNDYPYCKSSVLQILKQPLSDTDYLKLEEDLVKCSADAVGVAFVKVIKQRAYIIKQQFTCQFIAVVGSEELRSDPMFIVVSGGRPADCNKT